MSKSRSEFYYKDLLFLYWKECLIRCPEFMEFNWREDKEWGLTACALTCFHHKTHQHSWGQQRGLLNRRQPKELTEDKHTAISEDGTSCTQAMPIMGAMHSQGNLGTVCHAWHTSAPNSGKNGMLDQGKGVILLLPYAHGPCNREPQAHYGATLWERFQERIIP